MTTPTATNRVRVREGDRPIPGTGFTLPVVLILDNLRSAFNVGNILRLADAVRAREVLACGYTAAPPHPKLAKTARGCDRTVTVRRFPDAAAALRECRDRGFRIYGVETVEGARIYWETRFVFPAALIFGNEALGISPEALALCDASVSLPALGIKNSINVANCAAAVMFEALRQRLEPENAETPSRG